MNQHYRPRDHHHRHHNKNPQISFLVPFRANKDLQHRTRLWEWLKEYWSWELPDAEIVIGNSRGTIFSKTEAVNSAARKARGRIFVILDSDTYIAGHVIRHCAQAIDDSLRRGHPLWFIPYRHLYRLTEEATELVLESDPRRPYRFHSPPALDEVGSTLGSLHGHRYGAMIQIMPREAFETVGGMDRRFQGWGGEDIAFLRAVDTLYVRHKTTDNDVIHLWHDRTPTNDPNAKLWAGQTSVTENGYLASRYNRVTGDRIEMRKLVDESLVQEYWLYRMSKFFNSTTEIPDD